MARRIETPDPLVQALDDPEGTTSLRLVDRDFEALPDELPRLTHLETLELWRVPRLRTAGGLEHLTSLRSLHIAGAPELDLEELFETLARLPSLSRLAIEPGARRTLPAAVEALDGLLEIELTGAAQLDLDAIFRRLARLSGLRFVSLCDRARIALPESVAELRQVRELRVKAPCPVLPASITRLSALEVLEVAPCVSKRQALRAIPDDVDALTNLRRLLLCGHRITEVPAAVCRLPELRELVLNGSPVKRLPERVGDLSKLEVLDVSCCDKLVELPASFGLLSSLRTFRAWGTGLRALPAGFEALRLQCCELPDELLRQVKLAPPDVAHVDDLKVERPFERALPDDLGDPITLDLRAPSVAEAPVAFDRMRRLRRLVMQPAPSLDLGDALARLAATRLEELDLDGWKLQALPAAIGKLPHLRRLSLSNNRLRTLPGEIGALEALTELHLGWNPLEALPATCASLTALEELTLFHAPIRALPRGLGQLRFLRRLRLARTPLRALSGELGSLVLLQELDLEGCPVTDLTVLASLPALRTLRLNHGQARVDAAFFRALSSTSLEELSLRGVPRIDALPPEIGALRSLRFLDLQSMGLRAVPAELAQLESLRCVCFYDHEIPTAHLKQRLPPPGPGSRWRKVGSGRHTRYVLVGPEAPA